MDTKVEHLKMIQAVITRMAQNSFLLKGWAVTLLAGLFALAAADSNPGLVLVAFVPIIGFWFLDTFYLRQERLFRALYDDVRKGGDDSDFSMNTSNVSTDVGSWLKIGFSITIGTFYGIAVLSIVLAYGISQIG